MTMLSTATGLSVQMREGSRIEHEDAEGSSFMAALVDGRVNEAGYIDYLASLRPIYAAMEAISVRFAGDPVLDEVIDPALFRVPAIDSDLVFWAKGAPPLVQSAAVDAYVARIEATVADPVLYLAHHYTRYLGDLSGGQVIGRILQRTYGLTDGEGTALYRFAEIPKPKPYKDGYRARLDALPLSADEQDRVVDEVRLAFRLNQALFAELSAKLPQYLR